jgi:N-acyl-D-amino-acid deacylase
MAQFDLLIRNAQVIDGTGAPRFDADIGVEGDRVTRIGDLATSSGRFEIDLGGQVAAPGFIDVHTHDDRLLLSMPEMTPKLSQGVTTVVTGNCGISLAPFPVPMRSPVLPPINLLDDSGQWFRYKRFSDYMAALDSNPAAINSAPLVGHTTLRAVTLKSLDRAANASEIRAMRGLVEEALAAGAIGVSTGLFYEPAVAAPCEEVIEVCRPLRESSGLYCTHMRCEADRIEDSLAETFRVGRELGVKVVISHHKLVGRANYGRSVETLKMIAAAMRSQPVCLDCYPYAASSTILSADRAATAEKVLVTWSRSLPEHAGRDLSDIARELGVSEPEAVAKLLPAGAIYFRMHEDDVQRILAFDQTMIGSDGLPHDDSPHPRLWGTFPRVLGHYARRLGLFPLEQAVHKMTGLSALNFGLAGRGVIAEGAFADLTLFDPASIDSGASYESPQTPARGIHTVIVNGEIAWRDGRGTGSRAGRALRRGAGNPV